MARYIEKALDALHAAINANLATQLAAVETDNGLGAGDIPTPTDIVKGEVRFDMRPRLVQVYWTDGGLPEQQQKVHKLVKVDLEVAVAILAEPDDLSGGEVLLTRYVTAIIDCVLQDPSLGVPGGSTVVGRASKATGFGETQTRKVAVVPMTVQVHTP